MPEAASIDPSHESANAPSEPTEAPPPSPGPNPPPNNSSPVGERALILSVWYATRPGCSPDMDSPSMAFVPTVMTWTSRCFCRSSHLSESPLAAINV